METWKNWPIFSRFANQSLLKTRYFLFTIVPRHIACQPVIYAVVRRTIESAHFYLQCSSSAWRLSWFVLCVKVNVIISSIIYSFWFLIVKWTKVLVLPSQTAPRNPWAQLHLNAPEISVQVAPFLQGFEAQ